MYHAHGDQAVPSIHPLTILVPLNLRDQTALALMGQSKLASQQPILVENRMIINSADESPALFPLPLPAGAAQAPPDPHPSLCDRAFSHSTSQADVTSPHTSSGALVGTVLGLCGGKVPGATAAAVLMTAVKHQGCSLPADIFSTG